MVGFLHENKHFLSFHRGFVIDGSNMIVEIEFSVQLLPHLVNGLHAAVFLQAASQNKPLFLADRTSNILSFNKEFK